MTAEFASPRTLGDTRMAATLVIDSETPLEEVRQLRSLLTERGGRALEAALAYRSDGRLRFGAMEYPLNLVVSVPIEGGRHYVVITRRPLGVSPEGSEFDQRFPFGVAIFQVDTMGNGEGKIYPAAAIGVDEQGEPTLEAWNGEPGRLIDIDLQD